MMPAIDPNDFLKKWYWMDLGGFFREYSLTGVSDLKLPEKVKSQSLFRKGLVLGSTSRLSFLSKDFFVIGGPCISDCYSDFTLESIVEISNLLKISALLQKKAIVFLGIEEEEIRTKKNWKKRGNDFERIIIKLAQIMKNKDFLIARSDDSRIKKISEKFIALIEKEVTDEQLFNLYNVGKSRPLSEKVFFDYSLHKRFIVTYLPEFAMEITNSSKMLPVLACENLQQIKAFKQARAISSKLGNKDSLPEQLIHLPFPSITGECRMYRSSPENKIFVSDKQPKIKAIAEKLPESVLNYYSAVIPKEISGKKIRTRKDFAESFSYLQKKIGCG